MLMDAASQQPFPFPFYPVEFTKDGQLANPAHADDLLQGLADQHTTDLIVISHGWDNTIEDALHMYHEFLDCVQPLLAGLPALTGRQFAVLGVHWPSVMFADAELVGGAAAGLDSPVTNDVLTSELDRLKGVFDAPDADDKLSQAQALVPKLVNHESAQKDFATLLKGLLAPAEQTDTDAANAFQAIDGVDLFQRLSLPPPAPDSSGPASAGPPPQAGHAAGLRSLFGGIKAAALNLLNLTTYYQMKNRAGVVGQGALNALLRRVRAAQPAVRLHLVGHSFGCRLLSAATAGADAASSLKVDSLTLLQGAFSHYGFANHYDESGQPGFFRRVLSDHLVTGPLLITHTRNDSAVGTMYPLASRVAGQVAQAIGDASSLYGGLGSNGAQKTPEATDGQLEDVGFAYAFKPDGVYNLLADKYIHSHSNVRTPQTAYAFLNAVAAT
jgi:hypothetical protein